MQEALKKACPNFKLFFNNEKIKSYNDLIDFLKCLTNIDDLGDKVYILTSKNKYVRHLLRKYHNFTDKDINDEWVLVIGNKGNYNVGKTNDFKSVTCFIKGVNNISCCVCFEDNMENMEYISVCTRCSHLICDTCLEKLISYKQGFFVCPVCRFGEDDVNANR
jgi:hypothetical protein